MNPRGVQDRLRMAVVGVGHLGRHHARILAGLPDVALVAAADVIADRAAAAVAGKTGRSVDDARAALAKDNAAGRLISPDEVAAKVLWLCSPAANVVNGEAIVIAGGAA